MMFGSNVFGGDVLKNLKTGLNTPQPQTQPVTQTQPVAQTQPVTKAMPRTQATAPAPTPQSNQGADRANALWQMLFGQQLPQQNRGANYRPINYGGGLLNPTVNKRKIPEAPQGWLNMFKPAAAAEQGQNTPILDRISKSI